MGRTTANAARGSRDRAPVELVYVQPHAHLGSKRTIDFASFAAIVERHGDPWSLRFARLLREWAARGV